MIPDDVFLSLIIPPNGFGDTLVTSLITTGDAAGFLIKPYSFDPLREVLKRVVEGIQKQA